MGRRGPQKQDGLRFHAATGRWFRRYGDRPVYFSPRNTDHHDSEARRRAERKWHMYELLNGELFTSVQEAKVMTQDYRMEYNHRRPHSSLEYLAPAAFAAQCTKAGHLSGALPPNPRPPLRKVLEDGCRGMVRTGQTLMATGT